MLWSLRPCLTLSFVFLHGPKIALLLFSATYCLCGSPGEKSIESTVQRDVNKLDGFWLAWLVVNITLQQEGDKEVLQRKS